MIAHHIQEKCQAAFNPVWLAVDNESHLHAGPARESHFKVTVVSEAFAGMSLLKRHQKVQAILAQELGQIHALGLHTYTPAEFQAKGGAAPQSPACLGGSKGPVR
jgi:BolA protein